MKILALLTKCLNILIDVFLYACLLVFLITLLRVFVLASFKVPTSSMEPAIWPREAILVEKCSTGARLFDVWAALAGEEVNIYRMPGWRKFKRNDVLVFNFPYPTKVKDSIAFDVLKYYVKRCVGLPGDTLEIRNGYYKIAGKEETPGNLAGQLRLSQLPDSGSHVQMSSFPWDKRLNWTIKEFGPLPIPAKGQVVKMDSTTWLLYNRLISWEQKQRLRMDEAGRAYLGDSAIHEYRFQENYYFMAGDNVCNSQDSRYWGMLPEPFIVGRAVRVWKSTDGMGRMRKKRLFKKIE